MRMGRAAKAAQDAVEGIGAFGPNLPIENVWWTCNGLCSRWSCLARRW